MLEGTLKSSIPLYSLDILEIENSEFGSQRKNLFLKMSIPLIGLISREVKVLI